MSADCYNYSNGRYPVVTNDMVLYYHFNNDSCYGENSTLVYDFSGNGNNGTANNTQFQNGTGILGDGSYNFNGINANIQINSPIIINASKGNTLSFFFKLNSYTDTSPFGKSATGTNAYIRLFGGNQNRSTLEFDTSGTNYQFPYGSSYNYLTDFTLLTFTFAYYNSTHDNVEFYVNGIYTTRNYVTKDIFTLNYVGSGYNYYNGSLDELIVYNNTLTPQNIWQQYVNYAGSSIMRENLQIPYDTVLPNGTYVLNDSGKDGSIIIIGDNLTLSCSNTYIRGYGTINEKGIYSNNKNNVSIRNCNISNYDTGIWVSTSNSSRIYNNTIWNMTTSGITIYNNSNTNIYSNYIYGGNVSDATTGIQVYFRGGNNNIFGNKVDTYKYGIRIKDNSSQDNVYYNNVSNAGLWGISNTQGVNNTQIYNNRIYNTSWNSIHVEDWNSIIHDNYIDGFLHMGIDIHEDTGIVVGGNYSIYNNYITISNRNWKVNDNTTTAGINIGNTILNLIYNNTITNLYSSDSDTHLYRAISMTGASSYGNVVYDNNISFINDYCLLDASSSNIYNNVFSNCNSGDIRISNASNFNYSYYINNIDLSAIFNYTLVAPKSNVSISQQGQYKIYADYTTGASSIIPLYNLSYPYNDIRNVSNNVILYSNVNEVNLTLAPGQAVEVGDFASVIISPSSFAPGDSLTCSISGGSSGTLAYQWYVNGVYITNTSSFVAPDYLDSVICGLSLNGGGYVNSSDYSTGYGEGACSTQEHSLWGLLGLVVLAGFLLWLWANVESGMFSSVGFLISLVIIIQLIVNLMAVIISGC